jgi:uncharacterized protein YvpB
MKLSVPYYSQFIDIQDPFWMLRACGGVCLKSVAEYKGASMPDLVALCEEAKNREGYHMINGWVHDYIVTRLQEAGLTAFRKEGITSLEEIIDSIQNNNPVIVSVEKRVLEQTRFHLITLIGYDEQEKVFYYHESESTDKTRGEGRSCTIDVFMNYFRGKAIFVQ